jgi:hypothetical protein
MPQNPWKASTPWEESFRFFGRTGVTGWTIEISRDGANVANTGFAVAEVDAVNNEYLYRITATAAALATRGAYNITVYETAAPANSWSWNIKVTNDGTLAGSDSAVSWTTESSDGRITDGASAISGATLSLYDSNNVLLEQASTDSAGLATLYPDDDATYNLVASAPGYVNERSVGTLIVSSQTVISTPGADFALSAAATSSESITFAELIAYARRQKLNAASDQSTVEIKEAINEALFWLASEYPWPHLYEEYQITLYAPYETGTVSITSGSATVTGSGTTFPSWAASAWLYVNNVFLEVSTRDSNTQLTLTETYDAASLSGETYKLFYSEYTKPAGLLGIQRFLDTDEKFCPVSEIDIAMERTRRDNAAYNGFSYNLSDGRIKVWPCPNADTVYKYIGIRRPPTLVSDTDVVDWDPSLGPVLYRAIDWQLAIRGQCKAGDPIITFETLRLAVENAWGGMQDHRDRSYGQGHRGEDRDRFFDGDLTDFP